RSGRRRARRARPRAAHLLTTPHPRSFARTRPRSTRSRYFTTSPTPSMAPSLSRYCSTIKVHDFGSDASIASRIVGVLADGRIALAGVFTGTPESGATLDLGNGPHTVTAFPAAGV